MVEYKQPNETDLPALTICAYGVIYDEDLEQEYWADFPIRENASTEEKYAYKLMLRDMAFKSKSGSQLFNWTSITFESVVDQCNFYPNSKYKKKNYPCSEITEIVESINQGKKCFTIFSELNVTKSRIKMKFEYEMNAYIEVVLVNRSQINSDDHSSDETFTFTVHSPNIIP